MDISSLPYAEKKFIDVNGKKMAYIDVGEGAPIVFQHGNPTSSYIWRNIMPHCEGLGRLIAVDLIGMGDSEKLDASGPDKYRYKEQRDYLFSLWEQIGVKEETILVLHDWGSALGFDWANQNRNYIQGLVYMEAVAMPLNWEDWPANAKKIFQGFRSDAGEELVLEKNLFVEGVLPNAIQRTLEKDEMDEYRRPFEHAGEDRRPTLTWPREIPLDGEPEDVNSIVSGYAPWLEECTTPKLFVNANPGSILVGRQRDYCRTWKNQSEVTVNGLHFVQEDSPHEIGKATADFIRELRCL